MARQSKRSGRHLPDKGKALGRRAVKTRDLRPRFLIVCEGERTEPNYFKSFRVNAVVEVIGTGKNTKSLVEHARALQQQAKKQSKVYSDVWVVFDKDDFTVDTFNQAIEQARQAGFGVAYSNEAFELWYVLHFDYMDNAITRQQYQEILTRRLERRYDKNDLTLYGRLIKLQPAATINAEKLLASYQPGHNPAQNNPCTTVHLLVKELNQHAR